ncbi:MAG: glycosyltransferase family 4 protein, partial [Bacteroidaceae bacterium]|nr:glycosyltransferase family 4 protein [Bacteroidaceae bacterium]
MKIVYLNPTLCNPDGIERVLINQANYMADVMGYDVSIVLTDGKGIPYGYPVSDKVNMIQLNVGFYERTSKCSRWKLWWMYFQKMRLYKKRLTEVLLSLRPDVTVTLLRRELNFLHLIPDGSRKIGWVHLNRQNYRQIGFGPQRLRSILTYLWQKLFLHQLKRLDRLVVLTKEDSLQWEKDLTRVITIPNPLSFYIDSSGLCHDSKHVREHTVIAVGRYAHQKGFDRLIRIWSEVYQQFPQWQLHIYGRGDRTYYQQLVAHFHLQESCFLHPFESDVQSIYKTASIFAFSSRYEGFGLTLIEAMHSGLPCVSFSCPCGPRDIITDGSDGFLVETENQFAQRLAQLMGDESLRREMAEYARNSS